MPTPLRKVLETIEKRSLRAVRTIPGMRAWLEAAVSLAAVGVLAWILCPSLFGPFMFPATASLVIAVNAFFSPALVEELFFRVLILPPPSQRKASPGIILFSLFLFVGSHPLNAWLYRVDARPLFYDPAFLAVVAALGIACTASYLRTGSLWPPVVMHAVFVWTAKSMLVF